jgi:hypothetical protein
MVEDHGVSNNVPAVYSSGEGRRRTCLPYPRPWRAAAGQGNVPPCSLIMTVSVSELEDEVARMRDLDLSALRARWRSVFRRKAPDHLPRHLLYRMIAYRLQAECLGDLDRDTQRFLDKVAAGTKGNELPAPRHRRHALRPGTILVGDGAVNPGASPSSMRALPGTAPPIPPAPDGDDPDLTLMTAKPKRVRCAVYTRVSTEYGLDQEFNSLDAQHEASDGYIRSQAHDGWTMVLRRSLAAEIAGGCPRSQDRRCPSRQSLKRQRLDADGETPDPRLPPVQPESDPVSHGLEQQHFATQALVLGDDVANEILRISIGLKSNHVTAAEVE